MAAIIALRRIRMRRKYRKIRTRISIRDRSDPFTLPEEEFKNKFCLTQSAVRDLCAEIKSSVESKLGYSPEFVVLSCLQVLRSNTFQIDVSNSDFMKVSQATISRHLDKFLNAILSLMPKYIKFPRTTAEIQNVKDEFFNCTGLPGLIGCLDCTHINISKPSEENCQDFVNHKNEYSLNIQIVCDSKMKISDVIARWPGNCDDYFIWEKSTLRSMFETGIIPEKHYLIGDGMYPLEPWLLTAYSETYTSQQEKFNVQHTQGLHIIKSCIYLLKSRFRCLQGAKLQYVPNKACKIVLVCCILHNICLKHNIEYELEPSSYEIDDTVESGFTDFVPEELTEEGLMFRSEITSQL